MRTDSLRAAGGDEEGSGVAVELKGGDGSGVATVNSDGSVLTSPEPITAADAYSNVSVSTDATPLVAAGAAKTFLDIQNTSTSAILTLMAGSTIIRVMGPLATYTREGGFVPSDAITGTASDGTIKVIVGAR